MLKILVIDDDPEMRELIGEILESNQYAISLASDGQEGIDQLGTFLPDLVVCDIAMPKMDGFTVLKTIRGMDSFKAIPFIFLTGNTDRADFRMGMNLSADDYLTKPFHARELLDAVEARFQRSKQIIDSILNRTKTLESNLMNFLETQDSKKIYELEKIIFDLKENIFQKQKSISNLSFINSHLLRAPVVNILGSLEMAKSEPEKYEEALKNIGMSTLHLDEIIRDIDHFLHTTEKNVLDADREIPKQKVSKIFLIDDDVLQLKINERIIHKLDANIEVLVFDNPLDGLNSLLMESKLDLIFLDIFMPVLDGWGVLEEMKKKSVHIPVIMLSSSIDPEDIQRSRRYENVISYISKPLTIDKLRKIIILSYL